MACKMSCHYRKARLTEDSEWLTPALEVFLEAHRLLTNFMNFFRFHAGKCYDANYDAVPLYGALEIVPVAMTSIMCGNALRKGSPRSGMFHDMFPCFLCRRLEDLPEAVSRKVDVILTNLTKSCDIENIMREIKDVLSTLEKLEPCATSEKLHQLWLFLKEIMRKIICCDQNSAGPRSNTQTRLALNLVNNFIRDWSEKRSGGQPFLRTCKFCDHVISETTRQWGMFCCNEAENFNNIRTEWILRQSISDAHKEDPSDRELKSRPLEVDRFADGTRTICVTDYKSSDARCLCKNGEKSQLIRDRSARRTSVAGRSEEEASAMKAEVERHRDSRRESDKFDSVEGRDLTGGFDGKMVGEIKSRDIVGTSRHPTATDVRPGRDDVPYKSKLEEIRGPRGLRDASEKRTAVGKMRKIKRDEAKSETETDRLARRRGGASATVKSAEKSRSTARGGGRGVYRRRLKANERVEERVGMEGDADYGEKTSGRRRGKKPRNEEDVEVDETGDVSDGKGVRRVRKRRKPDAADSDGKGVSYSVRDEERGVRKTRDRKRLGEGDETDSDLRRRRKGVKPGTSSAADKSTLDSEDPSGPSKKGRRQPGSSRTDDDYSKTNGSRYRKGKTAASKVYDLVSGDPNSIEYQLSDGHFVSLGWTVLPIARTTRKIVEYQTMPAKPHLDWFKKHKRNGSVYYNDGSTVLVNFLDDGSAEVFYPNGVVAIKLQRPQNRKYGMYTVFSPGGKDCMGVERGSQIVAVFDTIGNGAVFDEDGATRLSYNQIGGISRDNPTGIPLMWKWDVREKKSPTKIVHVEKSAEHLEKLLYPSTKTILKSSGSPKPLTSPASSRHKEKKVEEQKPVIREHQEEEEEVESGHDIYPSYTQDTRHFKMICLSVNHYISLRILNRSNINLQFSAEKKTIKIELGTILNLNKKVESYYVDSSLKEEALKCKFERLLSSRFKMDSSMHDLIKEYKTVKRSARERKLMMDKYRPYLRNWLKSGTRCRPR